MPPIDRYSLQRIVFGVRIAAESFIENGDVVQFNCIVSIVGPDDKSRRFKTAKIVGFQPPDSVRYRSKARPDC